MKEYKDITVGVLALQGAFIEHEKMIKSLGANVIELRQKADLEQKFDSIILPGGESTVQGKLLKELDMFDIIKDKIINGMPVLATCAGLILLSEKIENDDNVYLGTLPVVVRRNAYGRQLGSFRMNGSIKGIKENNFPMEFIRAPYIVNVDPMVEVLCCDNSSNIVGVRYKNQIAFAFHPELTCDTSVHKVFLDMI